MKHNPKSCRSKEWNLKTTMRLTILLAAVVVLHYVAEVDSNDGKTPETAAKSCAAIFQNNPRAQSGRYYIRIGRDNVRTVNCDRQVTMCGVEGGWMKITSLDMKKARERCPANFQQVSAGGKQLCVKTVTKGCSSHVFSTGRYEYKEVCGKAIGYQFGTPNTAPYPVGTYHSIEGPYTDGVSITHGSAPRKHIWTYMSGWTEISNSDALACPCGVRGRPLSVNNFVGTHFYCESGNPTRNYPYKWYLEDPLWDGAGCTSGSSCCSDSGLPYFHRVLPRTTTDNIEVRICLDEVTSNEDIGLEELELYVR